MYLFDLWAVVGTVVVITIVIPVTCTMKSERPTHYPLIRPLTNLSYTHTLPSHTPTHYPLIRPHTTLSYSHTLPSHTPTHYPLILPLNTLSYSHTLPSHTPTHLPTGPPPFEQFCHVSSSPVWCVVCVCVCVCVCVWVGGCHHKHKANSILHSLHTAR